MEKIRTRGVWGCPTCTLGVVGPHGFNPRSPALTESLQCQRTTFTTTSRSSSSLLSPKGLFLVLSAENRTNPPYLEARE